MKLCLLKITKEMVYNSFFLKFQKERGDCVRKLKKNLKSLTPYVPGKSVAGAIKLASNENALGSSPKARKAVVDIVDTLHLYPDGNCSKLRNALAKKIAVDSSNLIFGNGSDELLLLVAGAFVSPGDEVITSEATFSEYTFSGKVFAGEMKYVPLNNFGFDLSAISKAVTDKTKLIYLCNPNNPTGKIFGDLAGFMAKIPEEIVVVSDEAYCEYVQDKAYPESILLTKKYKNLIVLRTFSKIYGLASLRVGYGIAAKELLNVINLIREPFNVNGVAQCAAVAALDDDEFVENTIANNEAGKKYLYVQLNELAVDYLPTETNFIFIYNLKKSALDIFTELMAKGVIIRPLNSFGFDNSIRVTIGTHEENEKFVSSLKEVL